MQTLFAPSQPVNPAPIADEDAFPNRLRWTREQCARLVNMGILVGRYELIDGVIIRKMGQNPPHRIAVTLVMAWLVRHFDPLRVQIQLPLDVAPEENSHNEPEPDAVLLARPTTEITGGNPGAPDVSLVIEVSDTTLRFDRTAKRARYARAGFPEYWVLDLTGRQLYQYQGPQPDGTYASETTHSETDTVSPLALPATAVRVGELLPAA